MEKTNGLKQKREKEMPTASNHHNKPVVLQETLFMWEIVASFSPPQTVCILERLSRDVHAALAVSSTGAGLLQRYWNAQYHKLIWDESRIDVSRRTLRFTLTRAEKKRCWKNVYREEYPQYVARTFRGKGANNNALNAAKALFKVRPLNDAMAGSELAKLELTPEEALARPLAKNTAVKVAMDVDEANKEKDDNSTTDNITDDGVPQEGEGRKRWLANIAAKKKKSERSTAMKNPAHGLTREDYNYDRRLGKNKSKHKKGGVNRWSQFASGEVDDD